MGREFRVAALAVSVGLAGCFGSTLAAEPLVMPEDLVNLANEKGCRQIEDFYAVPGQIDPPYVYGWAPGAKEQSVAFWCQPKNAATSAKPYLLVVKDDSKKASCPQTIEWHNHPRGLSVYTKHDLSLADFRYVKAPDKKGPKGGRLDGSVLLSSYDGVEEYFYCLDGDWLYLIKH